MKVNRKQRKPDSSSKLVLEEIIGLTTKNSNGLASNVSSSKCVYMAGCVAVVYDVCSCTQSHLMVSHRVPKPLGCVAMSQDGRFIAAGELGNQPAVLVWDSKTLTCVSELKGHLYGVECIAFSSDGEHLVSVGGYIYIWDWRKGVLVTKIKASSSCSAVTSVTFSGDAKFVVTAGKKHLKFWTFGSSPRTTSNKGTEFLAMQGRSFDLGLQKGSSFDLGPQKGSSFVSVISANWINFLNTERAGELFPIYALTDAGVLCLIHSGFSMRNSVDLKVEKTFALSASNKLIACACSKGVVQLFTVETLEYTGSILYSEAKGNSMENDAIWHVKGNDKESQITNTSPDAVACQFSTAEKLVVVYGDHSLYVWDIHDVNKVTRCSVLIAHSACIWDIKNLCCEYMHDPSLACIARGCSGGVSFATCSADSTIRLWDLVLQPELSELTIDRNHLNSEPAGTRHLVSAGIFERDSLETTDSTLGFRSLAVSQDGQYMAAGDCEGNLHIYDLNASNYTYLKDAHDAEILTLSFSLSSMDDVDSEKVMDNHYFLASGGRDRVIHLYDPKRNFDLIESIDDHSAAVTSVKLACNGCKILSCSADRSLVFRDVSITDGGHKISRSHHQMASHGTVYDMAIDRTMEVVVTVGQDKKINTFNIAAGKLIRSFKQDKDYGDPIKVIMDPTCNYLVCSYTNKSICMYDFASGEMVCQAMGHGEVVTGVVFLPDCKHIVSVGGDGCIFVWKLPSRFVSRMLQAVKEYSGSFSPRNLVQPVAFSQMIYKDEELPENGLLLENLNQAKEETQYQSAGSQRTSAFRFSISRLPKWAQSKVECCDIAPLNLGFTSSQQQEEQIVYSPLVDDAGNYASLRTEDQTPNHDSKGSNSYLRSSSKSSPDTDNNQPSCPQEVVSRFDINKRWNTVYNVCVDLLTSPEVQDIKDVHIPTSSLNLSKDSKDSQCDRRSSSDHYCCGVDDGQVDTLNEFDRPIDIVFDKNDDKLGVENVITHDISVDVGGPFKLDGSDRQETMGGNGSHLESEDKDIFKLYFGSLSASFKADKTKSSSRRRYNSQYVVRRDYLDGGKRLFNTPIRRAGGNPSNCSVESIVDITVENQTLQSSEKNPKLDTCKQITQNLHNVINATLDGEISENYVIKESSRKERSESEDQGGSELQERIKACQEALHSLNLAAENAAQVFSKLSTELSIQELSKSQLYTEASELLPSIAKKVEAIAEVVQHGKNDSRT